MLMFTNLVSYPIGELPNPCARAARCVYVNFQFMV
jgi:hypothetical protein